MGVLNVTPDSFADSRPLAGQEAVDAALAMADLGADIVDVGGESTRPGALAVPAREELHRVVPVVSALARRLRIPISIDTYKAEVAEATLAEGASLINDISALRYDPPLARVVAAHGAPLVLMHNRGRSDTMYAEAEYRDVVAEVAVELQERLGAAVAAGLDRRQLIVDPGIGFAKRAVHSYVVLAHIAELAASLERPVLVGPSRKSFMREAVAGVLPADRDWGTAAAVTAAVLGGAHIVRVHAVGEMVDVVRVAEEIRTAFSGATEKRPRGSSRELD